MSGPDFRPEIDVRPEAEFLLDLQRTQRIGLSEAVYCAGKTPEQIAAIVERAPGPLLLTRLDPARLRALPEPLRRRLDYDALSATAFSGTPREARAHLPLAIVTAGTSDLPAAREAQRSLRFEGIEAPLIADVGVAGLWRVMRRLEELRSMRVLIVAAGMDAALPTLLGGLVPGLIVALPTSVGYGVAEGGRAALGAILASCAPGIVTVNIDNGYGAACAALRVVASEIAPPGGS